MKRCPECRRNYTDETLNFCLDDGAALLDGPASESSKAGLGSGAEYLSADHESETAIFHSTDAPGEEKTAPQIHTTQRTEILPGARESKIEGAKRLVRAWIFISILLAAGIGGYFGYQYLSSKTKPIASIAVMPFVNASGNADLEYLSDGITETLINSLTQLPSMSVKARSAVFRYKGKDLDPAQIATELNAEAVLNGRVMQRGDTITLSLDLVDGATGNQIWGEQYNRNVSDLVLLQKEIARDVSNKLSTKLSRTDEKKLASSSTVDPEAYQLYLQGRYQWNKRTAEGVTKAKEYFQKAIEKDPGYALAYAGLADSYIVVANLLPFEAKPEAKVAGLKALELDPSLGEAHAVLGNVAFYYEWDWPTAEREYKRAIELNPNYATAHHWYGESLAALGKFDESFAEFKRAAELDPVSPAISSDLGWAYFNARQFDRAEAHLKKLIELDPSFIRTYFYLAAVYEELGRFPESIEMRRTGLLKQERDAGKVEAAIARLKSGLADSGEAGYWKAATDLTVEGAKRAGEPPNPVDMATLHAHLNDRSKAFEWLEKAYRDRWSGLAFLNTDPAWDNLRDDPRFGELLQRVGLPRG